MPTFLSRRVLIAMLLPFLAASAQAITPWTLLVNTNNIIVVTNATYGAVGDGVFTNTTAIQSAINQAAKGGTTNGLSGGTVRIPGPGIYLCGPLNMSNYINLQVDAGAVLRMLPYGSYPGYPYSSTDTVPDFISASSLHDIAVSGPGAIDGQGAPWWPGSSTNNRPVMLSLGSCTRELIQNITLSNSPMFHIAIGGAKSATVQGVIVRAPSSSDPTTPSHNTDACDVSGTNILVQNCDISTGDDDYTCGGGTHDVLLTNNVYGTGHGVSIGSYTDGGVSNIMVINCSFNGTDNGIRLKSERGRGGLIQNLTYCNLTMTNVGWPLLVYSYYEYGLGTITGVDPTFAANVAATNSTTLNSTTPIWQNITFSNITATMPAGRPPLMVWGLPEALASNIVFRAVNITSSSTLDPGVYNATNIQFIDCNFNLPSGVNDVQFWNAGLIFTNTFGNSTATNLWTLDGLTTNGIGNSLQFYNALATLKNTNAFDDGPLTLSASTFTISNNLSLAPNTVVSFSVGTNPVTLAVKGNLNLGGTNNIIAGPGFTNGTYTLMTYSGSLSGNVPTIGTFPGGYNCQFNTNTAGTVKLVVATTIPAPSAPTNLTAVGSDTLVSLNWYASATATNYNVKRATVSGGPYTTIANIVSTNYSDNQVTNGRTYYYVVSASNGGGESANSSEANATPFAVALTDIFSMGSTVTNLSPSAPTITNTAYQIISSKTWSPLPSITTNDLRFGIGATGSGNVEAEALFANAPVTLGTVGDCVQLTVTFTNSSGLLTGPGLLGFGLYNSGQVQPIAGGMNGTATSSTTGVTGGAQNWQGYVGQISYSGSSSRIMTRPAQTITTGNNQDLVTSGSSSSSYANSATVGSTVTSTLGLTAGSTYTEVLTITLTAANTLAITNSLYAGSSASGSPLTQFGGVGSGSTYVTNSFDAMALGIRSTASTNGAPLFDISQISVTKGIQAVGSAPAISGLTNQTVIQGTNATLAATVTGTPTPTLQWYLSTDGGATSNILSGQTGSSLTLTNVQYSQNGYKYYLVAANASGTVSSNMTLSVIVTPGITGLTNQMVSPGATAAISATVSGVPAPSLQWQFNGTNLTDGATGRGSIIAGSTSSTLYITNAQTSDTGTYSLVASNSAGIVTNSMTLTVSSGAVAPAISNLTNQTVNARFSVTLAPTISGSPAPALQWNVNGTPISGATNSTLTLTNVQLSQNGYIYSLTATNIAGSVTSNMTLTVTQALFNVQLNGLGTTYSGAGQIGAAGDVWNNPTLAATNGTYYTNTTVTLANAVSLKDSRGVSSPVTFSMTGTNFIYRVGSASGNGVVAGLNNNNSYFDYISPTVPSATITLAGLPPNTSLNLFGYGATTYGGAGSTWTFAAANGGASAIQGWPSGTSSAMDLTQSTNQGNCWIKIVGTTDSNGNLTVKMAPNAGGDWWQIYFNGFQVQLHTAPLVTGLTNMTVVQGTNITLSPTVTGTPAPTFQWQTNGVNIAGATNSSLSLNNVQYSQNGYVYSLVSSNMVGITTNSMTLTVIVTPDITGLTNQAIVVSSNTTISATVSGVPTPSLQWQFNGTNLIDGATVRGSIITGSTTSSLNLSNSQIADSGTYSLIASNSAGIATNSMTLTVSSGNVAPAITGPSNQTAIQGSNATFSASVTGLPVPSLQWLQNGVPIAGATTSTLTLTNVAYSQNGYIYSLVASNSVGMVTNSATLTVLVPVSISTPPQNVTVTNTQSATFNVVAGGVPSPAYQWYFNGAFISGATGSSYTIGSTAPTNIGNYTVVVSNSVNVITSSVATLTVNSTMSATALTPANAATGVCYDTPLYITFSSTPTLRTAGTIKIFNTTNTTTPVDTIDLSLCVTNNATYAVNVQPYTICGQTFTNFPVIITGTTAAIYPHQGLLTSNQTYYVTIDDGTFGDSSGAWFAGIMASNVWRFTTKTGGPANATNLVVAQDYSGDFATVQGAVNFVPGGNTTRTIINIRNGTYTEIVNINSRNNLDLRGQSRNGTLIGYPNNNNVYGGAPWRSCFVLNGNDCTLETLTVTNMTPYGGAQAEAVDVEGTRAIFFNMELDSHQDTFLVHSAGKLVYFQNSLIQGDTDFNWGYGTVYYTNCEIRCLTSGGLVTQPRSPYTTNGFGFINCRITKGYSGASAFYLGRSISTPTTPSEVLFANCLMDDVVTGYSSDAGTNFSDYACSNLTATATKSLTYSTHLGSSDPYAIAIQNAPTWLYGWSPALPPNILTQPVNQTNSTGGAVTFTVVATAIPDANYQWQKNGVAITGQTNSSLVLTNLSASDAANYSVVVSNGSGSVTSTAAALVISKTSPTLTLQSSSNPCGYKSAVTFTASLPSNATGNVIFSSVSGAFSTNALTGGSATSLAISSLPRGTNLITATYSGDGNYFGATNTLNQVVTNHQPTAASYTASRIAGLPLKISFNALTNNWNDGDGDTIAFISAATSTNGIIVYTNASYLLYTNVNNINDLFSYTVADSYGATAIGTINILIVSNPTQTISSPMPGSNGSYILNLAGVPGYTYRTQAATNLVNGTWIDISTNTADTNGVWQVIDLGATNYPSRYYRTICP